MIGALIRISTVSALVLQVFAGVYITSPVLGSSGQSGQKMTISWQDDQSSPSLTDIGPCEVGVFDGNMQQQTELQPVNPSVDVSKQTSLDFTVDATIGPNADNYFIRFTSLSFKDPKNPQFPYQAFSAKFALSGMSGQFSPAVQAQINGVTSASTGPTSALASAAAPSSATTTGVKSTSSGSAVTAAASKVPSSSASAPKPSNAATSTRGNAVGMLGAVGVAAVLLRPFF